MRIGLTRLTALLTILLLASCGNRETNPIGNDLVERTQGQLVVVPTLQATETEVLFDGVYPSTGGVEYELFVGRLSGLILRTMLRFHFPADSLAQAAGASGASALTVTGARIDLWQKTDKRRLSGAIEVERPDFAWDEHTAFADTVNFVEIQVPSVPLAGATVTANADSTYTVVLPAGYVSNAVQADPDSGAVEVLLAPAAGETFLTALVSRNEVLTEFEGQQPTLVVSYSVSGADHEFRTTSSADTYWAARDEAGIPPGLVVMCSVVRWIPKLKFSMPQGVPEGATVVSTKLTAEVDRDASYFSSFPFGVDRIDVSTATGDTVDTRFNSWDFDETTSTFDVSQAMVQGWFTQEVPNTGLLLKPRLLMVLQWVALRNPRLDVVYALPPTRTAD